MNENNSSDFDSEWESFSNEENNGGFGFDSGASNNQQQNSNFDSQWDNLMNSSNIGNPTSSNSGENGEYFDFANDSQPAQGQNQSQNQQELNNYWGSQEQFVQYQPQNQNQQNNEVRTPVNLGYKSVGLILIGILVVIIAFIVIVSSFKPKQKSSQQIQQQSSQQVQQVQERSQIQQQQQQSSQVQQQQQSSQQTQQESTQQVQQVQQPVQQSSGGNSVNLVEAPLSLNAGTGNQVTTTGEITGFGRYLVGNQIIYCIYVQADGNILSYFCNYQSYSSVSKGESVTVVYQIIDNSYISVIKLSK